MIILYIVFGECTFAVVRRSSVRTGARVSIMAATVNSGSWIFSVVIREYRGLPDSAAGFIFRLWQFHALARRSSSVFQELELLLSKNHETHLCVRLPVQDLCGGARRPMGKAQSIATKMVGVIHSPPDRAIRRSTAKPRINSLE